MLMFTKALPGLVVIQNLNEGVRFNNLLAAHLHSLRIESYGNKGLLRSFPFALDALSPAFLNKRNQAHRKTYAPLRWIGIADRL